MSGHWSENRVGYSDLRLDQDWSHTDRELERSDAWATNQHPTICVRERCRYPAIAGPFCGLHRGEDIAAAREGAKRREKAA